MFFARWRTESASVKFALDEIRECHGVIFHLHARGSSTNITVISVGHVSAGGDHLLSELRADLVQRWTTANVEQAKRLEYYEAALNRAVIPISIAHSDPQTFCFEMSYASFAGVGVCKQFGPPHGAIRGRRDIARSIAHNFTLLMNLQTGWTIDHRGPQEMWPCDVLMMDSEYPSKFEVRNSFVGINVSFSESWLRRWLPDPSVLTAQRIPGNSHWGRALSAYLGELSPDLAAAPPLPLSVIADQIGSLLAITAGEVGGKTIANTPAVRSLCERINDCVLQRSMEWELTAADVAASIGISVRTLHRTLAAADQTFGGALIRERARVALRMLSSPAFRQVTTAEIGRRAGFPSPSHFARVIRDRTGRTPLQLRRTAQPHTEPIGPLAGSEPR
jgi:AraC family transcriptional activator of tynA and feaB